MRLHFRLQWRINYSSTLKTMCSLYNQGKYILIWLLWTTKIYYFFFLLTSLHVIDSLIGWLSRFLKDSPYLTMKNIITHKSWCGPASPWVKITISCKIGKTPWVTNTQCCFFLKLKQDGLSDPYFMQNSVSTLKIIKLGFVPWRSSVYHIMTQLTLHSNLRLTSDKTVGGD